ncbi:hypothetical protein A3B85_00585 [Candidatus Nomurabacteria bacterium RIFCSPHIGHO2_02_FULL_37_13]|uniref:Uncharacterized protein n=1 Tax=Candidatus Nomurabacteria bacterium RIFCSPHIGHO2_02_FULL_37_13 TaxID=1801750 RepID=A0A1F6W6Q5_9BACT|nr:MAG: hypothetical protein A2640_02725 [Candidatus Nomurabacteria bacterium RIFCSPHIGHO2_01_FULL_36_23]OGI77456.1 MAG: hypothetical protein A3B85_00585 [Candidatus Nomurabacteria bacterium RIFCSPHIGHO2_02_FULL_37_13]OGI87527.1 MAG: hypothetical protein A2906_01060 [Candidatus Nomurabacteria bacterium RIFCSPLOWO2_01_FULL_37_25]
MNLQKIKSFIGIFILLVYISIGVFGLLQFNHMNETPMVNCPYTQNGYSICENSFGHINNWHQFSNAIFPSLFIFSFFILGIILYFLNKQNFLNQKQYFYNWKYYLYNKKLYKYPDRIIKWLSLFENSPSLNA